MSIQNTKYVLEKVYASEIPNRNDIAYLLALQDQQETEELFDFADEVRRKFVGDGILLRGIVEFSNYCRNTCSYCGLNKYNKALQRYRLTKDEIIGSIEDIVSDGIKTVVLQSGEEDDLSALWLKELIEEVKASFDIAVTLSVGERSFEEYRMWKKAGADRYLLKIETSDKTNYQSLHPEMDLENRLSCLRDLKRLGYQTGSGCIVGLKGQTVEALANDILFFAAEEIDMIGIGPFIPHQSTLLGSEKKGDLKMVLKVLAVTRIITKNTHLPATTATGSLGAGDGRMPALKAGANVLMPNYTPLEYKKLYEIYPGKRCVDEPAGACSVCMEAMAAVLGRNIDYSIGHSLKIRDSEWVT